MKYLKDFDQIQEGKGRVEMDKDGRHAIAGDAALPQTWDDTKDQPTVFDPNSLVMDPSNSYNYLMDADDYLDEKDIDKMIGRHKKREDKFGFDPSKDDLKS